jgi:hypothetical protein
MRRALPLIAACSCFHPVTAVDDDDGVDAGSTSEATAAFPTGTYTRCAFGVLASGPFVNGIGFEEDATLTVSQTEDGLTATFADSYGQRPAWSFAPATSDSANLMPSRPISADTTSIACPTGFSTPTQFDLRSGVMTYQSGAVFIFRVGEIIIDTSCGDTPTPGSAWTACTAGPVLPITAPLSAPPFPVGDYTCTSEISTHAVVDGKDVSSASGRRGSLALEQTGTQITARYAGDIELTGTLDLMLSAAGTGSIITPQTLTAQCDALQRGDGAFSITVASLTQVKGTVFLSVAGTMGEACANAEKIATLICTR